MKRPHIPSKIIYLCTGDKCKHLGNKELAKELKQKVKDLHLRKEVEVIRTKCLGKCKFAPIGSVQPTNQWFFQQPPTKLKKIFFNHIQSDELPKE